MHFERSRTSTALNRCEIVILSSLAFIFLLLSLKRLLSLKVFEYLSLACEDFLFLLLSSEKGHLFYSKKKTHVPAILEKSAAGGDEM